MNKDLRDFLAQLIGTIAMTLAPVVFTTFVTVPYALERHPGDLPRADAVAQHMT